MFALVVLLASLTGIGDTPSRQWDKIAPLLIGSFLESETSITRQAVRLNETLSAQNVFDPQAIAKAVDDAVRDTHKDLQLIETRLMDRVRGIAGRIPELPGMSLPSGTGAAIMHDVLAALNPPGEAPSFPDGTRVRDLVVNGDKTWTAPYDELAAFAEIHPDARARKACHGAAIAIRNAKLIGFTRILVDFDRARGRDRAKAIHAMLLGSDDVPPLPRRPVDTSKLPPANTLITGAQGVVRALERKPAR